MGLFCSKRKLREELEQFKKDQDSLLRQRQELNDNLRAMECENKALKSQYDQIQEENLKYKEIAANDTKTINSLNENIQKLKKEKMLLAAKVGGQKTQFHRMKDRYECELRKAAGIINNLESENKKIKNRPTLEELKLEKVTVSHENRKRLKK